MTTLVADPPCAPPSSSATPPGSRTSPPPRARRPRAERDAADLVVDLASVGPRCSTGPPRGRRTWCAPSGCRTWWWWPARRSGDLLRPAQALPRPLDAGTGLPAWPSPPWAPARARPRRGGAPPPAPRRARRHRARPGALRAGPGVRGPFGVRRLAGARARSCRAWAAGHGGGPMSRAATSRPTRDLDPRRFARRLGIFPERGGRRGRGGGGCPGRARGELLHLGERGPAPGVLLHPVPSRGRGPTCARPARLGVTILADHHGPLARQLAGDPAHRFDDVPVPARRGWSADPPDGLAQFGTSIHREVEAGDHHRAASVARGAPGRHGDAAGLPPQHLRQPARTALSDRSTVGLGCGPCASPPGTSTPPLPDRPRRGVAGPPRDRRAGAAGDQGPGRPAAPDGHRGPRLRRGGLRREPVERRGDPQPGRAGGRRDRLPGPARVGGAR